MLTVDIFRFSFTEKKNEVGTLQEHLNNSNLTIQKDVLLSIHSNPSRRLTVLSSLNKSPKVVWNKYIGLSNGQKGKAGVDAQRINPHAGAPNGIGYAWNCYRCAQAEHVESHVGCANSVWLRFCLVLLPMALDSAFYFSNRINIIKWDKTYFVKNRIQKYFT